MPSNPSLALYHVVMGEAWGDDYQKVRGLKANASDRQQRSYRHGGKPSARNVAKRSVGSRSAVFKRIRNGGCKNKKSLGAQLDYINDKAALVFTSAIVRMGKEQRLSEGQKADLAKDWQQTWRGTSKLGFTSHMLLSFPTDVSVEQVRDITMDWCEHFFESGLYEDTWEYVVAVHDDREHNHAHIVLNNRGNDFGTWFACWKDGVMSPQLMREKQAEIAEDYGVALDATTRLERGILTKPAGLEEIYAAKAEGRLARETALTEEEVAHAQAAVIGFAADYRNVADLLRTVPRPELADSVEAMAIALENGEQLVFGEGDIEMTDLKDIKTIGEAVEFAEANFAMAKEGLDELEGAELARAELAAEPVLQRNAPFVSDPTVRLQYNNIVSRTYPPGADAGILTSLEELDPEKVSAEFAAVLEYGRDIGLNMDEQLTRYIEGGSKNLGTVTEWIERDIQSILSVTMNTEDQAELGAATLEQEHEAYNRLDSFQKKMADELGLEFESVFRTPEAIEADLAQVGGEVTGEYTREQHAVESLQWLADVLRDQDRDLSEEQEERLEGWMFAAMQRVLGDEGIARLERGDYKVLEGVLDNPVDQIDVTRQYLKTSAELRGAPELEETGFELLSTRATIVGAQEKAQQQEKAKRLGLDLSDEDEMGL